LKIFWILATFFFFKRSLSLGQFFFFWKNVKFHPKNKSLVWDSLFFFSQISNDLICGHTERYLTLNGEKFLEPIQNIKKPGAKNAPPSQDVNGNGPKKKKKKKLKKIE